MKEGEIPTTIMEQISVLPHPLGQNREPLKIRVTRNARARRMILTVRPSGETRLTLPQFTSLFEGKSFVKSKVHWLAGRLAETEARRVKAESRKKDGGTTGFPLISGNRDLSDTIDEPEAIEMLKGRTEELSVELGIPFLGVTVRRQRTRWGSCSAKNHINLNLRLACLPPDLVDYVIIHELVHTRVKNHGPDFWRTLDDYLPGAAALRDALKGYSAE